MANVEPWAPEKLKLPGATLAFGASVALPLSDAVCVPAELTTLSVSLCVPLCVAPGENVTDTSQEAPAANELGQLLV